MSKNHATTPSPKKAPTRKKVRKTRFLRVKNWSRFQHYKKRNPPWIRLHRSILRDRHFLMLTEIEQWQLVRLWLIASENDNKLADDEAWLRRAIGTRKTLPVSTFKRLGFLETWSSEAETPGNNGDDASEPLAPGMQSAEPDSSDVSEGSETRDGLQPNNNGRPSCPHCPGGMPFKSYERLADHLANVHGLERGAA